MEKAILKTLIYADIFDYPLKAYEIHKWLIGRRVTLRQVEQALGKLVNRQLVTGYRGLYFLPKRKKITNGRLRKIKQSQIHFRKAKIIVWCLKIIPWIKLVGISGGLAMENADKSDDIDLFAITAKNRLWTCRLLILGFLSVIGQRRKPTEKGSKVSGKFCLNILLEEDRLGQINKDLFTAHEVLQMKVLWQRGDIYSKFLENNNWAFKFLPNWIGNMGNVVSSKYYVLREKRKNFHNTKYIIRNTILDIFEKLAKNFQLWYMKSPQGMERIEDGALYFHPEDCRQKVLTLYRMGIKAIISP